MIRPLLRPSEVRHAQPDAARPGRYRARCLRRRTDGAAGDHGDRWRVACDGRDGGGAHESVGDSDPRLPAVVLEWRSPEARHARG
jgi:hypothetical protein